MFYDHFVKYHNKKQEIILKTDILKNFNLINPYKQCQKKIEIYYIIQNLNAYIFSLIRTVFELHYIRTAKFYLNFIIISISDSPVLNESVLKQQKLWNSGK